MNFIENIKNRAKNNKKKIVLPETNDKRIIEAAKIVRDESIADIILIGKPCIENNLENIEIIDPNTNELTDRLIDELYEIRKEKGMTLEQAKELILNDYMYYACMLVKIGYADGVVSGACHSTADTLRPALQIIKKKDDIKVVSSFCLLEVQNCIYGEEGKFIFSDPGLIQNPTSEELVNIAISSAETFKYLIEKEPKIAMLSYSTKGSAKHSDVDKVVEATKLINENYPNYLVDGELQLDAAIIPEIAESKAPNSKVAGYANVLIFPNLDAGNIGYKLVQRLAKAESYGPITQGLNKPINDLSRGCDVNEIVGVIAITCVQAMK